MNATDTGTTPPADLNNEFDSLCQAFEGGSFYGLEHILEDVFQRPTATSAAPARPPVDWFGLYE
ncbi:MAG: hypothetical protein ACXW0H_06940 [Methylobacter sp.]